MLALLAVATVPRPRNWLGLLQRLWAPGIGIMATDQAEMLEPRAEQRGKPLAVCRAGVWVQDLLVLAERTL